ncbi:hypothetical protein V1477_020460 [Vespula maculifrons]|uniref:Uncharacterized protein n=1 Tax=Vespula maculifrons TaxID=7453 RepID=A0ABD2APQ4_VESMC
MELKRREEKRREKKRNDGPDQNESTEIELDFSNAAIRSAILAHHKILKIHKYFRPRSHRVEVAAVGDPRANGQSNEVHHRRTFNRAREHHACARRHTRECSSYPTRIPRGYIEIREEEEKMKRKKKRRREREEEKKQMRRKENKSVRTREKDEAEKKGKKRISVRCNGT